MANQLYNRQVLLHSSSDLDQALTITVQTAPLYEVKKIPYLSLALLCLLSGFLTGWIPTIASSFSLIVPWVIVGAIIGAAGGVTITLTTTNERNKVKQGILFGALLGALIVSGVMALVYFGSEFNWFKSTWSLLGGITIGAIAPVLEINLLRESGVRMANQGFSRKAVLTTLILTVGLGISSGLDWMLGGWNQFVLTAILSTGLPLAGMIVYPIVKRSHLMAKYRQSEQFLIKP